MRPKMQLYKPSDWEKSREIEESEAKVYYS